MILNEKTLLIMGLPKIKEFENFVNSLHILNLLTKKNMVKEKKWLNSNRLRKN